ncbi:Uncharacterised protein [Mycobacteroides abscessus subsp. abscessus]|nr:Uncharacterised protein [Mycobacteroides abscessus subsp. abscessus]
MWNSGEVSRKRRPLGPPSSVRLAQAAATASLKRCWSTTASRLRCECVAPLGLPLVPLV